jgi:dienelactone hydrolase
VKTNFLAGLVLAAAAAQGTALTNSHVGNLYPFMQAQADRSPFALSYGACQPADASRWRVEARAKMGELLRYSPAPPPQGGQVLETVKKTGHIRYRVRYAITRDRHTEAFLLVPDGLRGPAPAVLALHDHGGFYYFGKEKITETEIDLPVLKDHIRVAYGGRTFADELARRGFVVLVPDAFYFGAQRLDPASVPPETARALADLKLGSDNYVRAFNTFASAHEEIVAKTLFTAGTTWPGVLFQGDRASLDYLLTRPEVDTNRIGCLGLSIGGFRAAHLFGLDGRIKAGIVAGWMTTYSSLLFDHLRWHTWMIYVPGQHEFLDLPDVASLNAPNPLLVINCSHDILFTLDGMKAAEEKLARVYTGLGAAERFRCSFYDEPHSFKVPAQEEAFEWLCHWLKAKAR